MKGGDRERQTRKVDAVFSGSEHWTGLRPAGEAASRVAAPIVARGGGGVLVRLKAEWSAVAGAELAAQTWPEKLGRDGALKLRVAPGFALDLQHRASLIIDRINVFFGRAAVTRLALVQGTLPLAELGQAASQSHPPSSPRTADTAGMLDSQLAGVEDAELRAALARLGEVILRASRQSGEHRQAASVPETAVVAGKSENG
jgi:hypothetical protein